MTMLIERYLMAALEHVPENQRDDVSREIRGAISEMIEQRVDAGEPEDLATERALNELGDPEKLAMSYQDRPRYLIGPGWYPGYVTVLKTVLAVALPFIVLATLLVDIGLDGESTSDAIQDALGVVFSTGLQIVFWVTLVFALLDRFAEPDVLRRREAPWTVAELRVAPAARQITLGGVLPDIIAMIVVAVLVAAQARDIAGIGVTFRQGESPAEHMSLLNPAIGAGWTAIFFALVLLSIISPVARYVRGYWTRTVTVLEIVDSALWIAYIVVLAATVPIVNPAFAERVDAGATWWKTGSTANVVIAIIVIWISLQTAWDAWQGHRAYRRMNLATTHLAST